MGLAAGERRDALHEIENALGLAMFFAQHGVDDLRRLRFGETALAQKAPGEPRGINCRAARSVRQRMANSSTKKAP